MDWANTLGDIFQRYSGQGGGTAAAPQDPHQDFQTVAQSAPQNVVANGISQAFRSDQTPSFPEMLATLFTHSDGNQRAGLLNRLLQSAGPGAISSLPNLGGLSPLLGGGSVTPEQASQVSPAQVQQLAAHAERQNPSVVDEVSGFFAQHPDVMKAVGGLALTIALQHMLKHRCFLLAVLDAGGEAQSEHKEGFNPLKYSLCVKRNWLRYGAGPSLRTVA